MSAALLDELANVLRSKFEEEPADVPLFGAYRDRAHMVIPEPLAAPICRDPNDDIVLATAKAAKAHAIVTGDSDLLALGMHEGVRIMYPRQFIEMFDRSR